MEITEQRILSLPAANYDFIDVYKRTRDGEVDYVVRTREDYWTIVSSPRKQDAINTALNVAVLHLVCVAYTLSEATPNRSLITRPLIAELDKWERER